MAPYKFSYPHTFLACEQSFTYTEGVEIIGEITHMTQQQYKKMVERELRKINARIDFKILQGERYTSESRRHKRLLSEMRRVRGGSFFGMFA